MKQGKFEAGRKAVPEEEAGKRRPDWLLILVPLLVVAALAAILSLSRGRSEPTESTESQGLSQQETMNLYRWIDNLVERNDMVLTLRPEDPEAEAEPIVLTIPPAKSHASVDLGGLLADLEAGVGKIGRDRYQVDPSRYVSLNRKALRELAEQLASAHEQPFLESFASLRTIPIGQEEAHVLVANEGRVGRDITAQAVYETLLEAYQTGNLAPVLQYRLQTP